MFLSPQPPRFWVAHPAGFMNALPFCS
uniref:Uncharacterized protein n=1 Tax=Rhizophora mucronata TaxID=61149 RepID=A0A2P2NV38_RHIMU